MGGEGGVGVEDGVVRRGGRRADLPASVYGRGEAAG